MVNTARFEEIVEAFNVRLAEVPEDITGIKLSEDCWSLREIIGHLIDSASNNHQRFVRLQFDDLLDFPAYDGESWVKVQNYAAMDWKCLIALWYSYNCMLLKVIGHMNNASLDNVWVKGEEALPLLQLVNDYYRHLEWHIHHFEGRVKEIRAM